MISLQGNLDVLPLDRAITRLFVQIDLDVEQLKKRVRVRAQFSSPTPTGSPLGKPRPQLHLSSEQRHHFLDVAQAPRVAHDRRVWSVASQGESRLARGRDERWARAMV